MLRRLEKRIYIPLPDFKTREELFETFLNSKSIELVPRVNFQELAAKTEGYSGSDVKLVCKEALMSSVRKMLPNMTGKSEFVSLPTLLRPLYLVPVNLSGPCGCRC